ncbi:MAG: MGDG synthase family glycosyltransferase, partial [Sciscionella sp.]
MRPLRVAIISASIAAGHDGVAAELGRRLRGQGHQVQRLDFVELIPHGWGRRLRSAYQRQLGVAPRSWDWLLATLRRRPALRKAISAASARSATALRDELTEGTDVVVCTYPLAAQAVARLKRRGAVHATLFSYVTDPAVHPLWVTPATDAYLVLDPVTATAAHELGATPVTVIHPLVAPAFRPAIGNERAAAREHFGLPAAGTLILV